MPIPRETPLEQRTIKGENACGCTFYGSTLYAGCTEAKRLQGVINYYLSRDNQAKVEQYREFRRKHLAGDH